MKKSVIANLIVLGLLAPLAVPAYAGGNNAGDLVWTKIAGNEGWLPRTVSIGNQGTQVFTQVGPFLDYTWLFSAHDANPPVPVWTNDSTDWTFPHNVDSAEDQAIHVSLHESYVSGHSGAKRPKVSKYTSSSSVPDWQYTFSTDHYGTEPADVKISRNGEVLAAASFDGSAGFKTRVVIFGPNSPVPLSNTVIDTHGAYTKMILSGDGSTIYFWANSYLTIFDVASAQVTWSKVIFDGPIQMGHALSDDGKIFAYGGANELRVMKRNLQGIYNLIHTAVFPAGCRVDAIAISQDGSTLAAGVNFMDNLTVRVVAWDLPHWITLMSYETSGQGEYSNLISALGISGNGYNFVAGLWGDQAQSVPEVLFFDRDHNQPIGSGDLPGSVLALDVSGDGRYAVVASKEVHANVFAGGGRVSLFMAKPIDFRINGTPELGSTVEAELYAPDQHSAQLLVSPSLAPMPEQFPGIGLLFLNRANLTIIPMGLVGPDGFARCNFPLGSLPVGSNLYFQGLSSSPRRLSNDWVKVTVLP